MGVPASTSKTGPFPILNVVDDATGELLNVLGYNPANGGIWDAEPAIAAKTLWQATVGATGAFVGSDRVNIDTTVRSATGEYVLTFLKPIPDTAIVAIAAESTAQRRVSLTKTSETEYKISITNASGTPANSKYQIKIWEDVGQSVADPIAINMQGEEIYSDRYYNYQPSPTASSVGACAFITNYTLPLGVEYRASQTLYLHDSIDVEGASYQRWDENTTTPQRVVFMEKFKPNAGDGTDDTPAFNLTWAYAISERLVVQYLGKTYNFDSNVNMTADSLKAEGVAVSSRIDINLVRGTVLNSRMTEGTAFTFSGRQLLVSGLALISNSKDWAVESDIAQGSVIRNLFIDAMHVDGSGMRVFDTFSCEYAHIDIWKRPENKIGRGFWHDTTTGTAGGLSKFSHIYASHFERNIEFGQEEPSQGNNRRTNPMEAIQGRHGKTGVRFGSGYNATIVNGMWCEGNEYADLQVHSGSGDLTVNAVNFGSLLGAHGLVIGNAELDMNAWGAAETDIPLDAVREHDVAGVITYYKRIVNDATADGGTDPDTAKWDDITAQGGGSVDIKMGEMNRRGIPLVVIAEGPHAHNVDKVLFREVANPSPLTSVAAGATLNVTRQRDPSV